MSYGARSTGTTVTGWGRCEIQIDLGCPVEDLLSGDIVVFSKPIPTFLRF